ncbi:hypothetical protein CsSME_00007248 [Camellia sinensis var. sinensis]
MLVARLLKKLQRDFLWGSGGEDFRKVVWRFVLEHDRLWRRVVVAKYGVGGGSGVCGKGFGWGRWSFGIGWDSRWDWWCGEALSEDHFPLIFSIVADREASVAFYLGEWGCSGLGYSVAASLVGEVRKDFPWKSIWMLGVPSKVAFFTWTTASRAHLLPFWDSFALELLGGSGWALLTACLVIGSALLDVVSLVVEE